MEISTFHRTTVLGGYGGPLYLFKPAVEPGGQDGRWGGSDDNSGPGHFWLGGVMEPELHIVGNFACFPWPDRKGRPRVG